MKTAPLLSIGMIFKNEERCLERCLQSLEPLRKAIPCELIMADTGATDGSRAIAGRYADEVFDFEWIDDFSAARNAVMDRCHGKWYLSIDCDEWLDEDISELLAFLKKTTRINYLYLVVRNYFSEELEQSGLYGDFNALRLLRMSTGQRYINAVHESWPYKETAYCLSHTILHHDGYLYTDPEIRQKKLRRNMQLLCRELEKNPKNLRVLNECIESGQQEPEYLRYVYTAVELIQGQAAKWDIYGAGILRYAAEAARARELPELWDWIEYAQQTFSESIYTRIDLQHTAFQAAYDKKEWMNAVRYGEAYRESVQALHERRLSQLELKCGPLLFSNTVEKQSVQIGLGYAYLQNGQSEQALETLTRLDVGKFQDQQIYDTVTILNELHAQTTLNVSGLLTRFYEQLHQNTPDGQPRPACLAAFDQIAAAAFTQKYRAEEQEKESYRRPAYTAFAALADVCEAGRGAKVMMAIDPAEMREWLLKVEDWQALPIEALEYALREGVEFPLPEKPLPIEVLDGLAARLTREDNLARQLALALPEKAQFDSLQRLYWAQALVLAALQSFDWTLGKKDAPASKFACPQKKKEDAGQKPQDTPEIGLALLRRFAGLEAALLPLLYTPQALAEENAALLPPMHRWGLYCAQAFELLDAGRPQEYLAVLRKGLAACPGQKETVQFLLDRFKEQERPAAKPEPSPELLALAGKVRGILAAYGPDHPAAKAIRESEAYKQVAWLIENEPNGQPRRVRRHNKVRAVFFAELGEKWDAMQSVYEYMRADDRFDPVVVRTPVFRVVQQNGQQKQETIYKDFLTPMGIPSLGYDEYDIEADCPELAFTSQPYESCTLPQFWPENLAKHTRLVYLPYFLSDQLNQNSLFNLTQMPVYHTAWKMVCSGKKHYDFYCRHAENKGANALVTGLPKTDPVVCLDAQTYPLPKGWEVLRGKTVFLWNSWYDLGVSSLRYFEPLLEWFGAHPDCALLWRRHPMTDTVTKLYYPDRYPAYQKMLWRAEAAENILIDKEIAYLAAFAVSHAMISDYSSLQPQYLLLDKPTLWIRGGGFRFTGEEFIDTRWMEQAGRAEDIFAFMERVRAGEDRNAALRQAILKRDLPLADGHCGQRVCEAVWQALHEENGVV